MKNRHMFIMLYDGKTSFLVNQNSGSNPAKNLQEHLDNISHFITIGQPTSIEIKSYIKEESAIKFAETDYRI
jgi:hypothetical protein